MSEQEAIEKVRAVFKIVSDQCNTYSDCHYCPFEKVFDDASGACKFRLETGYAAWELFEMFENVSDDE